MWDRPYINRIYETIVQCQEENGVLLVAGYVREGFNVGFAVQMGAIFLTFWKRSYVPN